MTIEKNHKLDLVQHAIRWSSNMLVEVVGNYAGYLPSEAREKLKSAIENLTEASQLIRLTKK